MEYLVTTQEFNTPSKKLNKEMNGIVTAFRDGEKAGERVAKHLTAIYTNKLYEGTDYEKFTDVIAEFGIGKQYGYKLVNAYTLKYLTEGLTERLSVFKLTQIMEFASLVVSDIMLLVDEGKLAPSMTSAQLRQAVRDYKDEIAPEDDTEPSEDLEVGDDLPEDDLQDDSEAEAELPLMRIYYDGDIHDIEDEKVVAKLVKILVKEGFIAE